MKKIAITLAMLAIASTNAMAEDGYGSKGLRQCYKDAETARGLYVVYGHKATQESADHSRKIGDHLEASIMEGVLRGRVASMDQAYAYTLEKCTAAWREKHATK